MNIIIPYAPRRHQTEIHNALDEKRFGLIVAHRRFGKTVCTLNQLIKKALLNTNERPRFGYIAPFRTQAESIAWEYLKSFTAPIPDREVNISKLEVTLPNSASIRLFGSDNADALRGLYFDGVVIDEPALMRPNVWGEIIRPCLADRQGWAVFIGTPRGMDFFYELYLQALRDETWHTAIYRASETGIIPQSELDLARQTMSESQYLQEFECDWGANVSNSLIYINSVLSATKRTIDPLSNMGAPKIMSVDVARFGDDKTIIGLRTGLEFGILRKYRDLDLMTLAGNLAATINEVKPDSVFVDSVGLGAGLCDRMRQLRFSIIDVNAGSRSIYPGRFYNKRAEMWDNMRQWLENGGKIPDDRDLIAGLCAPRYEYSPDNKLKLESKESMKSRGLSSPDEADCLALTFAVPVSSKEMMEVARRYERLNESYDELDFYKSADF